MPRASFTLVGPYRLNDIVTFSVRSKFMLIAIDKFTSMSAYEMANCVMQNLPVIFLGLDNLRGPGIDRGADHRGSCRCGGGTIGPVGLPANARCQCYNLE